LRRRLGFNPIKEKVNLSSVAGSLTGFEGKPGEEQKRVAKPEVRPSRRNKIVPVVEKEGKGRPKPKIRAGKKQSVKRHNKFP